MEEQSIRKMPFSLSAEQSLLGSILIDPEVLNKVADQINADDFYLTEHKQIYLAMHELFLTNSEIDVVTLLDMLVTKGIYDKSGGEDYIRTLASSVPDRLNAESYAKIIKSKSILRRLIDLCGEVSESAYSEQDSVENIIEHASNRLYELAQGKNTTAFRHIRDVMNEVYGNLHDLKENKEATQGTMTGFSGLDRVLAGMGKSDLVLVGARPGMGKTSFALNIATNVAKKTKKTVCIFSLEMSASQLVSRMISSEALINSYTMRTGDLQPEDWEKLAHTASELASCDILIDDTAGQTATAIKAKLRRVQNLGLVVIDYLGLMQGEKHQDNRVQEVADISRALKVMAKDLMVPIICCAQLSRGPESRTDKKPMLSDLRDSGAIEQDADTVIFLYRSEYYKTDNENQETSIAEVIIAKNRHGSTGTVKMGWNGQYTKFVTIADEEAEAAGGK